MLGYLCFALMPVLGCGAELMTEVFSRFVYPLFPTPLHRVGVISAVGANFLLQVRFQLGAAERWPWLRALLLGYVTGWTGLYVVGMLPALPLILWMCCFGLGLLAAAPYWTAIGLVPMWRDHWRGWRAGGRSMRAQLAWALPPMLLGPVLLVGQELESRRIAVAFVHAAGGDPESAQAARGCLRAAALGPQLLLCADGMADRVIDGGVLGTSRALTWYLPLSLPPERLSAERCRQAFYLAHGRDWSEFTEPDAPWSRWGPEDRVDGADAATGIQRGLRCRTSRIEAEVEPLAGVARIDWTFEFENATSLPQEARLGIAMHPAAVASALSLWVGGEERPAAFAAESKVVGAYATIARTLRRDPALLRETAPGRLRLLLFPVPESGGRARVRIGITTPLDLRADRAELALPRIHDRNFSLPAWLHHELRVRDGATVDGRIVPHDRLAALRLRFPIAAGEVWTEDADGILIQRLHPREPSRWHGELVLVVDDSATTIAARPQILDAWPRGTRCALIVATAGGHRLHRGRIGDAALRDQLAALEHEGGIDPVPALTAACELVRTTPSARLIWLHGAQPITYSPAEFLIETARRDRTPLLLVPLDPRRNSVADQLARTGTAAVLPRSGSLTEDLAHLTSLDRGDDPAEPFAAWTRQFARAEAAPASPRVSDQIARLHASTLARNLAAAGSSGEAAKLAARLRLATAGAGAVVLERSDQYDRFSLDPGAPLGREPASPIGEPVPEPQTWLLFGAGFAMLILRRRSVLVGFPPL